MGISISVEARYLTGLQGKVYVYSVCETEGDEPVAEVHVSESADRSAYLHIEYVALELSELSLDLPDASAWWTRFETTLLELCNPTIPPFFVARVRHVETARAFLELVLTGDILQRIQYGGRQVFIW